MSEPGNSSLVIEGLRRAADIAWKRAAEKRVKVGIWTDGKLVHVDPRLKSDGCVVREDPPASEAADGPKQAN